MNYLAHIYLSGDDDDLMIGNFIADAVKGQAMHGFREGITRGIILHRAIDEYTDNHPLHKMSRTRLHSRYGHYSGVIVDIFYDHFLASNWYKYSASNLEVFTNEVYDTLMDNHSVLPERIKYMLKYMIPHNWLLNYGKLEGIDRVLHGMSNRTKFNSGMENAIEELQYFYEDFDTEFSQFFPEVQNFVKEKLVSL